MKKFLFIAVIITTQSFNIYAQTIQGHVMTKFDKETESITGANVSWLNTTIGVSSDEQGFFTIEKTDPSQIYLRISFVGLVTDTIEITDELFYHVLLMPSIELGTVIIQGEQSSSSISTINPINQVSLDKKELLKAACCNLSESFETNATVDAEYSDAITGTKTIKLLGLDGVYAQITIENIASVRGLSSAYGLTYIPGPWIESIQITKGVGSVVNGYESITGAINTEIKKPYELEEEKFLLNLFGSNSGRFEGNINFHHRLNEKFSTSILAHTSQLHNKMDDNGDTFLDAPLTENYILMNRWHYSSGNIHEAQAGIKYVSSDLLGGQVTFNEETNRDLDNGYGVGVHTNRIEAYIKNGFVFGRPNTSIGTMVSGAFHDVNSYYGLNNYTGREDYFHMNVIGQTYLFHTDHLFKAGGSFMHDAYNELYDSVQYIRNENVPGIFAEYYYKKEQKLSFLAGARVDFHNLYGTFFSPRIHTKFAFTPKTNLRLSGGKGYRVANIFAENSAVLTSARNLVITEDLLPEEGWNYGLTFIQLFTLDKKEGTFTLDAYRTDFVNQIIVDLDSDAQSIFISNLHGQSFSNVLQAEINYELFKNFTIRTAYKYVDAKTTYHHELFEVPLTNKHRGLINIAYETKKGGWVFDATSQFYGATRLPDLSENLAVHDMGEYSPDYVLMLGQITKKWNNFEVYAGSENITNYLQHEPVIAADDPFGEYFDASVIYAPIMHRKFYAGIRLQFKTPVSE
ncbi:MAG: TonB-dependent receptor [Chitinophagales bacterium]|nr:TonB-dependent receptor [Chitinophagales bacterium]